MSEVAACVSFMATYFVIGGITGFIYLRRFYTREPEIQPGEPFYGVWANKRKHAQEGAVILVLLWPGAAVGKVVRLVAATVDRLAGGSR